MIGNNIKTNVTKKNYAFRVRYKSGEEGIISVMAESRAAAELLVKSDEYELVKLDDKT